MNSPQAAFLICISLLTALPSVSPSGADEFATTFCPGCWEFLKPKSSLCDDGSCLRCGKIGIAVDASELRWTWCLDHQAWHRRPCLEGRSSGNPRVRTALALVVSPGDERLQKAAYCPECRIVPDPMRIERGRCPSCKGALAAVDTAEAAWFWCSHGLYWKEFPCPENGVRHCCIARRGTLLAEVRGEVLPTGSAAVRK